MDEYLYQVCFLDSESHAWVTLKSGMTYQTALTLYEALLRAKVEPIKLLQDYE